MGGFAGMSKLDRNHFRLALIETANSYPQQLGEIDFCWSTLVI